MPIIEVDHLTKEYRLGSMQGLNQTLLNSTACFILRARKNRGRVIDPICLALSSIQSIFK